MIDLAQFATPLFSEAYRRILAEAGVAERQTAYPDTRRPSVRERIVRCVWFDQSLATDKLRTDDGRKLRVLSPGWWNLESGPDFRNAALRIAGGPVLKGDVEVHLTSDLWRAHGHHADPSYNGVVLHVCLRNDAGAESVTTAAGKAVPQLTLEPYLAEPIADLAEAVDPAEYPEASDASAGRCQRILAEGRVPIEWFATFLDHAGDQRIASKARRLAARASAQDDDQLLTEAIAEGLGYKRNQAPMLQLARRAPLALLRERVARRPEGASPVAALQALLFGTAGLLPQVPPRPEEPEAARYFNQLAALWAALGEGLADQALEPAQWSFDGTRPVNFPTRRIAALARFLAAHLEDGVARAIRRALAGFTAHASARELSRRRARFLDLFLSLSDPFWSVRSTFTSRPASRPSRLCGTDRAHTLVINALLPALLYQARRDGDRAFEEALHRLYATYPKLPSTSVTRCMSLRMFGRPEKEVKLLRSARRQQGLYQLHGDFCNSDRLTCAQCPLARLLEG